MSYKILVVDDEADIRCLVCGIMEDEGYTVMEASNSDEAWDLIIKKGPDLLFLDIWLQDSPLDGLEFLEKIRTRFPYLPSIMISGHGTIETAVSAVKKGAFDYVEKPFRAERLLIAADQAIEASKIKMELRNLKDISYLNSRLIGSGQSFTNLINTISKIAITNSRVLICGATGTGKETVARFIHENSIRSEEPYVSVCIKSLPVEEISDEIFGKETNDGQVYKGALERVGNGTLYLEEISCLPYIEQSKLLRMLIENRFKRNNGSRYFSVNFRIISSSSRDLETEIEENRFQADLFHRIAVMPLRVPSLAERREDIPELVEYFRELITRSTNLPSRSIAEDAMVFLQAYDWPGNLHQLRNCVERLMIMAEDNGKSLITIDMLPRDICNLLPNMDKHTVQDNLMSLQLREAREVFERDFLRAQIRRFGGNVSKTAEFVGMERSALHRKLKLLGVS